MDRLSSSSIKTSCKSLITQHMAGHMKKHIEKDTYGDEIHTEWKYIGRRYTHIRREHTDGKSKQAAANQNW